MICSAITEIKCATAIRELQLPESFQQIVSDIVMPLANIIIDKKKTQPLLVSINGAQGTGKSTLTTFLRLIIESELNCNVAELSLDDFYCTRTERIRLAQQVHPLFITRGVPGTHDLNLLDLVIESLLTHQKCKVPRFNKARDDRYPESDWSFCHSNTEIILFEGWCNNSPWQNQDQLAQAINQLEKNEDPDASWRNYANEQLKEYHRRVFDRTDLCIMLQAPDFEHIYEWRRLQEQKLKANTPIDQQNRVLSDTALKRFIMHYERISRHTLRYLPNIADLVLPVAADHSIVSIKNNHV